MADRSRDGSIRSSVRVPMGNAGIDVMPLNVDVSPVVEGSRIRLGLVVEYTSAADTSDPKQFPRLEVKQRLSLVLEDGKPVRAAVGRPRRRSPREPRSNRDDNPPAAVELSQDAVHTSARG